MTPEAEEGWRIKARGDLLAFSRWMFKSRKGAVWQLGRHHHLLNAALLKVYAGETKRLIINIPPRYSKTEFVVNFMAWSLGQYPDCEFIYTSYSGRLAAKSSYDCRSIVAHPEYQRIFPGTVLKDDSTAKDEWRTTAGGMVYAVGAGGTITGYGAGKMRPGFGGCFPYDQEVETNIGPVKIGDIVTKQMPVLVWSVNKKTGAKELAPVDTLWTNPANDILEVTLDDGSTFRCTPNHKILTSRGWIEARHFSEAFDLTERKAGFFHRLRSGLSSVGSRINDALVVLGLQLKAKSNAASSDSVPCFPNLDLPNRCGSDPKISSNINGSSGIIKDFDGIFSGELCSRAAIHKRERPMPNRILHILRFCSPRKITGHVIRWVPVKMPSFVPHWTRTNKCFKYKDVDVRKADNAANAEIHPKISPSIWGWLDKPERSSSPHEPGIADFIKPIGSVNRLPVSVRLVGHENVTFCLEVRYNNNFILSQSGVIVSNCIIVDDPHKADEATSEVMRENVWDWFQETLESRTNSPDTPIIVIMQRLHQDDLCGHLLDGHNGEKWEHLCLPALSEDGQALWPFKHTAERLEQMRSAAPYAFSGQYMQRPAPKGGSVFRPDQIQVIEVAPAGMTLCRGWDQAASAGRGDYTVGALLGRTQAGEFVIVDIARRQTDAPRTMLKQTAQLDGPGIRISWPQDPGAAGKDQAKSIVQDLAGWNIKTSPETGAKETRWEPFAAQVNGGNVKMVRAPWNRALLEEMEVAPNGAHDDQLDALARAFSEIGITLDAWGDYIREMAQSDNILST